MADKLVFIKVFDYVAGEIFVSIRATLYSSSIGYFLRLLEEAKKDFPDIRFDPEDVEAVEYGGDTHKGQRGIEFSVNKETDIPLDYSMDSFKLLPHK